MRKLIIRELKILDYKNEVAQTFDFSDEINIIVSKISSTGKSSLIKSIFYALGFDIKQFPNKWNTENMIFKEYVTIDGVEHSILRKGNLFNVDNNTETYSYSQYSKWLASQMNIDVKLQIQNTGKFTDPYPTEMLLFNYIDQDKSWDGFLYKNVSDSLKQYGGSNAVRGILEYELGISDNDVSESKEKKANIKNSQREISNELKIINVMIKNLSTEDNIHLTPVDLNEIQRSLKTWTEQIQIVNDDIDRIYNKIHRCNFKLNVINQDISELKKLKSQNNNKKSKIFNKNGECSYCHSKLTIEQSLSRFELENNVFDIQNSIIEKTKDAEKISLELQSNKKLLDEKIEYYNSIENNSKIESQKISLDTYLNQQVNNGIRKQYNDKYTDLLVKNKKNEELLKEIDSKIRKINSELGKRKKEIKQYFGESIAKISVKLNSEIINDIQFDKFRGISGSGTENNRAVLGGYLAYFKTLDKFSVYKFPYGLDSIIKTEIDGLSLSQMYQTIEEEFLSLNGRLQI